jgi:hypothetical protein
MGSYELRADERGVVVLSDNLQVLSELPDESVELVYIDPPFNTGRAQTRHSLRTSRDPLGDRVGFQGERYRTERLGSQSFADRFDDYLSFLAPRLSHARRVLKRTGSLYFHIDYREVHYCKLLLDELFGRAFSERDHLGLRLRRAHLTALAAQARQHPGLREGPRALPLRHGRSGSHPVHGARLGRP